MTPLPEPSVASSDAWLSALTVVSSRLNLPQMPTPETTCASLAVWSRALVSTSSLAVSVQCSMIVAPVVTGVGDPGGIEIPRPIWARFAELIYDLPSCTQASAY